MSIPAAVGKGRFQRIQEVLREAAGDSPSDYGGLGPLWELPLEQLLTAALYGVRLIAPESVAPASCCSHTSAGAGETRADRSGLVQGLRGDPPFDGSRFPRLPWGGRAVSAADVAMVADWINDGCPRSDRELASFDLAPSPPITITLTRPQISVADPPAPSETFGVSAGGANEYLFERGELKQRMNVDCMDDTQLAKLRFAMREMYELNKWVEDSRSYNSLALIHQNHCQHGWERFLPWHRVYLYEFEQALQDHCPDVTMPYWDWTMPKYCPSTPEKGCIIPPAFQGFITKASLDFLSSKGFPADAIKALGAMEGKSYPSPRAFFAAVQTAVGADYTKGERRKRFIDALLEVNSLWYPLRYPAQYHDPAGHDTINTVIHYHYPTADDMAQIMSLRTFRDFGGGSAYDDAFGFLDQNPHNTLHIWTGGMNPDTPPKSAPEDRNKAVKVAGRRFHSRDDMYSQPELGDMFSNLTASYDPIFWPVHANIDRLWWDWQQLHPSANPVELDAVLTPWSYTIRDTLDMQRFGYEYVKSTSVVPVGASSPVGRFTSQAIDIPEAVRGSFGRAEVRLHRVPQLPRSCFIRVFLNLPDADAATPLDHAHYAGYAAVFGHGDCYGGPGHCDPPPPRARKYDLRPRSHNTPRNHRVDVTAAARRLIDGGATTLQITLVVIGVDYREERELLRLDGVSLNFLD
jgi:tyrosinase